jgi:hypothetical protein
MKRYLSPLATLTVLGAAFFTFAPSLSADGLFNANFDGPRGDRMIPFNFSKPALFHNMTTDPVSVHAFQTSHSRRLLAGVLRHSFDDSVIPLLPEVTVG